MYPLFNNPTNNKIGISFLKISFIDKVIYFFHLAHHYFKYSHLSWTNQPNKSKDLNKSYPVKVARNILRQRDNSKLISNESMFSFVLNIFSRYNLHQVYSLKAPLMFKAPLGRVTTRLLRVFANVTFP